MKKTLFTNLGENQMQAIEQSKSIVMNHSRLRSQTPQQEGAGVGEKRKDNYLSELKQNQSILDTSNPIEYYKQKNRNLADQLKRAQDEIQRLTNDVNRLRDINQDYVGHLNQIGEERIEKNKKQLETSFIQTGRGKSINTSERQNSVEKNLSTSPAPQKNKQIRDLRSQLKQIQKEQEEMIQHAKYMQNDIKQYKQKIELSEHIINEVKKCGVDTIEDLTTQNRNLKRQLEDTTYDQKDVSLRYAIGSENYQKLNESYQILQADHEELRQEHEKLMLQYNRLLSESEEKRKLDKNMIYQLKCRVDFLSDELRGVQGNMVNQYLERQELTLKVKDVESQNQNLKKTLQNFSETNNYKGGPLQIRFK